jgi:putative ABC transport system permease protein
MWRIAWRNLWRNRARTFIVATAIALTYAMFLVSLGVGDDAHGQMEQAAVKTPRGHVLIHGDGFWAAQSSDLLIPEPVAVRAAIAELPDVEAVIPRVLVNGLISSPRGNAAGRLTGIDPDAERLVQDLSPFVTDGAWVSADQEHPLVLGSGVVEELEIELGDRVVLTATDPEGEVVRALFRLTGVLHTGSELLDDTAAYTTIAAAQEAVAMGERLTQLGVLVSRDDRRFAVQGAVRDALAAAGLADALEVLVWDEAIPEMRAYIEIDDRFNYLFSFIVFVVVCFGIANSFLMIVMERIRELGLLGALGLAPGRIGRLLLAETLLLGAVAMLVGLGLGYGIHLLIDHYGINLSEIGGDMEISGVTLVEPIMRSEVRPVKWLVASFGVFTLILLSSLYPAFRASRLDPAEAMRTYE